jgi:DNA invertase Pin-like site-specific DNA recombinase|nr:recombinase family protein [Novosphingobium resinovorum]
MLKAALYARYSSDLQNVHSIDDQLLVCRELAARERWEIVAYYHDEARACGANRPAAASG